MRGSGQFAIIVIGASTGGVDALTKLAAGLRRDLQAAVFVVQHIGRHPSTLPELLGRSGPLPARHAAHGQRIEPGRIYVAPPDRHMLLESAQIRLSRGPRVNWTRPAIDPLFLSAAHVFGERVIGVILTGGLDDGSAGLHAVRAAGGLGVVQNPAEASSADMPANALRHAGADFMVSLAVIPGLLADLAEGVAVNVSAKSFEPALRANP